MPRHDGRRPKRRTATPRVASEHSPRRSARHNGAQPISDRFFRQLVFSMRNGVLVITRDGRVAAVNTEACRIFKLKRNRRVIGQPFLEVLRAHPDVVRVLASAFELRNLPNRAELRLRASGKVIGYTLSHICDERGRQTGAALFFKDLTRVEQLEERERLRDRLAALGEMAAAIAHEVKNPLAGIEVMAGLLRRQVPDSPDAQSILQDIINEVGPIVGTSANFHGAPTPKKFEDLDPKFAKLADLVIIGKCKKGIESTVVDASGSHIKIVRQGAVPASVILSPKGEGSKL